MRLKNELLPHQLEAVEKLRNLKVGALFMEQGTGKALRHWNYAVCGWKQGKWKKSSGYAHVLQRKT